MLVNTRFLTASMRLSFCVFFGFICAQSCTREDDVKFTGFHHFSYPSWSDMALKKLDRTMKKGQTVERYRRWMMASNKDPAVHARGTCKSHTKYMKDIDIVKIQKKLQVVTTCDPRSLVILFDASLMGYDKLPMGDINRVWTTLSILTYQQIAQRLLTLHAIGTPFRLMIAVYGRSVRVLLDRKITNNDDIAKIFEDKLMGKEAMDTFLDLATEGDRITSKELQDQAQTAIRLISQTTREKRLLDVEIPFHWVIFTNHVQIKHLSRTKEFNIDTLSNVKINDDLAVLLTTSNSDGTHLVSLIKNATTDILKIDQDVIGWNLEMETQFCRLDLERMFFLGFNDTYKDPERNPKKAARLRRFPTPDYLAEHGARTREMMRFLGADEFVEIKKSAKPPKPVRLKTDYNITRSGCRGTGYGDLDDQLDKFFGMNGPNKLLTEAGKKMFSSSGGPRGQWSQRSFKFTSQYFSLMDEALKQYGVDAEKVKYKTDNHKALAYHEYKTSENGILSQSEENRLWNWGHDDDEVDLNLTFL